MAQASATLGLSNETFIAGINAAERRAQTFEQRLGGLFRRDPLHRAERAFTDLATNLSSGNIAQGIAGFASKISGLGLAAGVGIGAAVGIFQRLATEISETDKAAEALGVQLDKPRAITTGLGIEGLRSELQKDIQLTDQLIAKSTSFLSRLGQGFREGGILGGLGALVTAGREDIGAGEIGAGLQAQIQARKDIAASETQISNIRATALGVSEQDAALQDIARQAAEKKAAILNETVDAQNKITLQLKEDEGLRATGKAGLHPTEIKALEDTRAGLGADDEKRIAAVDRVAEAERAVAQQKFEAQARAIAAAQDEANMEFRGVTASELKIAKLKDELGLIQDQLAFSTQLTSEAKAQLQVEETKAKTLLREAQLQQFLKPPAQQQQDAIDAAKHLEDIKRFERAGGEAPAYPGQMPRFDISGNLIQQAARIGSSTDLSQGPYFRSADAYGGLGEPSPKTGHVYKSQLDALSRHMEPLASGITTGTGPSDTWRDMFPSRDVLGPQPQQQQPGAGADKGAGALESIKTGIEKLNNTTERVWGN